MRLVSATQCCSVSRPQSRCFGRRSSGTATTSPSHPAARPSGPRRGVCLPYVVHTAGGPLVRYGQRDGQSDVLYVAVCPAPRGHALPEQDGWPAVIHPLQVLEESVLVVSRTVYR